MASNTAEKKNKNLYLTLLLDREKEKIPKITIKNFEKIFLLIFLNNYLCFYIKKIFA